MDKAAAIKERLGRKVRLRPLQKSRNEGGKLVEGIDDEWWVAEASDKHLRLVNARLGHSVGLTYVHVEECGDAGLVTLRCQITLDGDNLIMEPLHPPE